MGKELTFKLSDKEYSLEPLKLERKKLYGWSETVALDSKCNECGTALLDETRTLLIPKGGLGTGALDTKGNWVDKCEIITVDEDGKERYSLNILEALFL